MFQTHFEVVNDYPMLEEEANVMISKLYCDLTLAMSKLLRTKDIIIKDNNYNENTENTHIRHT